MHIQFCIYYKDDPGLSWSLFVGGKSAMHNHAGDGSANKGGGKASFVKPGIARKYFLTFFFEDA